MTALSGTVSDRQQARSRAACAAADRLPRHVGVAAVVNSWGDDPTPAWEFAHRLCVKRYLRGSIAPSLRRRSSRTFDWRRRPLEAWSGTIQQRTASGRRRGRASNQLSKIGPVGVLHPLSEWCVTDHSDPDQITVAVWWAVFLDDEYRQSASARCFAEEKSTVVQIGLRPVTFTRTRSRGSRTHRDRIMRRQNRRLSEASSCWASPAPCRAAGRGASP